MPVFKNCVKEISFKTGIRETKSIVNKNNVPKINVSKNEICSGKYPDVET